VTTIRDCRQTSTPIRKIDFRAEAADWAVSWVLLRSISMLDFELLRAFVAVADCGGFHRAAERLNLTQSTISQQIKRLEFETKRPLFRRTTRSVGLTNDGQMLLSDARRLLQLEEAARYRLVAPRLSGSVRLGVVAEVAGGSMPSALGRFATLHPNIKLKVQIGVNAEMIGHLNSGRLDLVFAERAFGTSRGRLVWRDPLVWAAAETFDPVPGAALPLALYRERSVQPTLPLRHSATRKWPRRSSIPAPV
jgi:DNA-binding transcriptional LysR family regulator